MLYFVSVLTNVATSNGGPSTESGSSSTTGIFSAGSGRGLVQFRQEKSMDISEYRYDFDFYLTNYFEYEQGNSEPIVRGRMKANLNFWRDIGTPDDILRVIEFGYPIPFFSTPEAALFNNNKSALDNAEFVSEAINDLLSKKLIIESSVPPVVVNPLTVSVQSSGKKRLILDLRYVNHHIWKTKIHFEDWAVALQYFRKNHFMFSFDLKSGYHHIDIYPEHCKYLSFAWDFGSGSRYFSFQVLPFGLSSAPFIFTKCLRPLVKHWRNKGFFIVVYLDDGWCIAPSLSACDLISQTVKSDLLKAGLVANHEKSVWTPSQELDWLGLSWNTEKGALKVIERRVSTILTCIDELTGKLPYMTARQLAGFVGRIISLIPVTGHVAQLRTRFSTMAICEQYHWDKVFRIPGDSHIIEELFFWKKNLRVINNRYVFDYTLPQVLLYSDASHSGCGAWTRDMDDSVIEFNQSWTESEIGKSSTWRELKGVDLALRAFATRLQGKCVKVFSDNKGVEAIVKKGSMRLELHTLSVAIATFCRENNIELHVQWVPREENALADALSREVDFDDWGVSQIFFKFMDSLWGPHSVDRFADDHNAKLKTFNSKYWCPNTSQVDAFAVSWQGENNWLVPPIAPIDLVGQAVKHLKACKAQATLVIPYWPSAAFWPILFSCDSTVVSVVDKVIRFSDPSFIYVQGRNKNSIFGSDRFTSEVLCVRLNGRL